MPTYEYRCEKCAGSFEIRQSMKDAHLTICPQELCRMSRWGKGKVKREMGSGAGLIFKGSGFYITDYRSEGYKTDAKKDAPSPATPAAGGGDSATATPKTATTPAAAPAAKAPKEPKSPKPTKSSNAD